jgi:hypothetical protein
VTLDPIGSNPECLTDGRAKHGTKRPVAAPLEHLLGVGFDGGRRARAGRPDVTPDSMRWCQWHSLLASGDDQTAGIAIGEFELAPAPRPEFIDQPIRHVIGFDLANELFDLASVRPDFLLLLEICAALMGKVLRTRNRSSRFE